MAICRYLEEQRPEPNQKSAEFGAIMRRVLDERLSFFEAELGTRPFVAGERFTVADITALCAIDFARIIKLKIDVDAQPNLALWHAAVSSRPSTRAEPSPGGETSGDLATAKVTL